MFTRALINIFLANFASIYSIKRKSKKMGNSIAKSVAVCNASNVETTILMRLAKSGQTQLN